MQNSCGLTGLALHLQLRGPTLLPFHVDKQTLMLATIQEILVCVGHIHLPRPQFDLSRHRCLVTKCYGQRVYLTAAYVCADLDRTH